MTKKWFSDSHFMAAVFVAFIMVFIKKWEPGGNLDTIWYSALCKNIAEAGDYFHFFISRYYLNHVFDHMPLSYWIIGTLMRFFGATDLVARIYPMICSFFSYLIVYKIGCFLKNKDFGLVTLLTYAACFGSSKWNGAVMHDVPLTTYLLATFYCFLLGREEKHYWLWMALFFTLGIWTKGPIIFGFLLGVFLWSLWERNFYYFKMPRFYGALLVLFLLLLIPFLPVLRFDGVSVYEKFFREKVSYLAPARERMNYFDYFNLILQTSTITIIPFFFTFWLLLKRKTTLSPLAISYLYLIVFTAAAIIIPLSFFKIKFPHYLLPFYPFFSMFAAPSVYFWYLKLQKRQPFDLPLLLKRLSTVAVCAFVALPIKTTGKRTKNEMNLVNLIKLDRDIKNKNVYFYGVYEDNMIIFQTFKFYGSIDLRSLKPEEAKSIDLKNSYVVINNKKLPIEIGSFMVTEQNCFLKTETLCVVTDPNFAAYDFPDRLFPHEVY
jgi:4-amino-4-deoxy-L-arabinose transferase-like glycosyltransferase